MSAIEREEVAQGIRVWLNKVHLDIIKSPQLYRSKPQVELLLSLCAQVHDAYLENRLPWEENISNPELPI